jgi:DNA-binding transcriptional regulator GbsR (MarR family)
MREQHDLHERLERRSHDLAAQLRELRRTGAPREAWAPVRDELHEVLNHQFEVRTRLREFELERIERELQELRRMLQKLQHGLERRAQERDALIQRRFDALLGADVSDW